MLVFIEVLLFEALLGDAKELPAMMPHTSVLLPAVYDYDWLTNLLTSFRPDYSCPFDAHHSASNEPGASLNLKSKVNIAGVQQGSSVFREDDSSLSYLLSVAYFSSLALKCAD